MSNRGKKRGEEKGSLLFFTPAHPAILASRSQPNPPPQKNGGFLPNILLRQT